MKKILNKNYNNFLIYFFISIFFLYNYSAKSEIIKSIEISGNDRLSSETIIIFSELNINDDVSINNINSSIKNLYNTNYFKNIDVNFENGIVKINVIENPIIQTIKLNGLPDKYVKELNKYTKKIEKYPYTTSQIEEQRNLLLNVLRSSGYYFVSVEAQLIENNNNSVDIDYNFNLGDRAQIGKIKFIGKKVFKDSKLRNVVVSEETKPWKFLTSKKFLDTNRITLDKSRLINFYKNKGYYNVKIKTSSAKITDKKNFELTFNIDSGKKYYFNNINLNIDDDFPKDFFKDTYGLIKDLNGKKYSSKIVEDMIENLNKISIQNDFVFVNAKYETKIVNSNKLDINIYFDKTEQFYVDRINIFGNFITEEKVIRNSLIVDEGDAFNKVLFNKSLNNLRSKNLFKEVKSDIVDSADETKKKVININVEEKPTGQFYAGVGVGTMGSTISGGVRENNYLGKGITLETNLSLSEEEIKGRFSVLNPNYKNSDKSLFTTIESSSSDYMSENGFKTSRTGFSVGTKFEQYDDLFVNLSISNYYEKLETSSLASDIKKKQEGDYLENIFNYGLTLNKLDQNFQPTEGYKIRFNQSLPIYSDDLSIENTFDYSKYYSVSDDFILSAKLFAKSINSIDDNVRVSKRIYIPSRRLRGFERIGPKDGTQYIGGNFGTALNFNSTLPNIFYEYENVDLNFFVDVANLWQVDYDSSLDSNKIRSSTGIAVDWFTPIGPLSFSYAIPISEASTDKTESFRFQIGTTF